MSPLFAWVSDASQKRSGAVRFCEASLTRSTRLQSALSENLVDPNRLPPVLDVDVPYLLELDQIPDAGVGEVVDANLVGTGKALQARGHIHRVADGGVLDAPRRADVAHNRLACVDAEADL